MTDTTWALPPLSEGEFAPDFNTVTRFNPRFHFNTAAGRYMLLAFMPRDPARRAAAVAAWEAHRGALFDDYHLAAFFVAAEPVTDNGPRDSLPGMRWFYDPADEIRGKYQLAPDEAVWFLIDPSLRILARAPLEAPEPLFARMAALPPVSEYAGVPLTAPVLIIPRVFEPELCRTLIDYYEARGGTLSGVMRDIGGRTVGVLDPMKRRRDVMIEDQGLRRELLQRIDRAIVPMIRRALQFSITRLERYIVACYDADEGGYFKAHRDNETLGTAHRRFACSINLNAEEFEGGDVRFPEFGQRAYRPPTGGAVVFCCSLQHEATPVTRGRRYAFLPFLYDEEGQEVRDRNRVLIDNSAAAAAAKDG